MDLSVPRSMSGAPDEHAVYLLLAGRLAGLGGAVVAFSGGVDSGLLLAAAVDALGPRALAVTARSPVHPADEFEAARRLAAFIGARHLVCDSAEMDLPAFLANAPDRCYHCKRELFIKLRRIADDQGLPAVLDGSNHDDIGDYRPGRRAARELGVLSPLASLGLGKEAVRRLARWRAIPNWDSPASACLASRIPYGEPITKARLARVEGSEAAVRRLGFRVARVRDHGEVARIELDPREIPRALGDKTRLALSHACKSHGFRYVSIDADGYRTGSLNEALPPEARAKS